MADFRILDKVNNANPPSGSGVLLDTGSGYVYITVIQLKDLLNAELVSKITTIEQDVTSLDQGKSGINHVHAIATADLAGFMSPAHFTKLEGLDNNFKGRYTSESGLTTAHPSASSGNWAFVNDGTPSVYVWDAGLATPAWVDTGSTATGDMLRTTYDPNGKGVDVYDRANHTGLQGIATIEGLQTALNGKEPLIGAKADAFNKPFGSTAGTVAEGSALAGKSDTGHGHDDATPTTPGFLSTADKQKLDAIEANATNVTVDTALSDLSTNPVENRLVKGELDKKADKANVLEKNNVTVFTPSSDYHPATKKYADEVPNKPYAPGGGVGVRFTNGTKSAEIAWGDLDNRLYFVGDGLNPYLDLNKDGRILVESDLKEPTLSNDSTYFAI